MKVWGIYELLADITDPMAAQKILDKRYLTSSVGSSTDSAICSICKTVWAEDDGSCSHRPGKTYEGQKCVIIAGNFSYDEYSFVNKPADTLSQVLEVGIGVQDDTVTTFPHKKNDAKIPEVSLIFDSIQEDQMLPSLEEIIAILKLERGDLEDVEAKAQAILDHITKNSLVPCTTCEKKDFVLTIADELFPKTADKVEEKVGVKTEDKTEDKVVEDKVEEKPVEKTEDKVETKQDLSPVDEVRQL